MLNVKDNWQQEGLLFTLYNVTPWLKPVDMKNKYPVL